MVPLACRIVGDARDASYRTIQNSSRIVCDRGPGGRAVIVRTQLRRPDMLTLGLVRRVARWGVGVLGALTIAGAAQAGGSEWAINI